MRFVKMHGAGNDYVYVDALGAPPPADLPELARRISHRRFGVGSDGLIVIRPSEKADARMQMFNADGSESGMCGNGIRCVAKYLHDRGYVSGRSMTIETGRGVLPLEIVRIEGSTTFVRVDMDRPRFEPEQIPTSLPGTPVVDRPLEVDGRSLRVTCLSMGNPHCVLFVDRLSDDLVHGIGPKIEHHPAFPERTNVAFVERISPTEVRQRTWERGSGETWACGTGASAVCVAGVLTGRTGRKITVHLIGGDLELEWDEATDHVWMTGPAVEVFEGAWPEGKETDDGGE